LAETAKFDTQGTSRRFPGQKLADFVLSGGERAEEFFSLPQHYNLPKPGQRPKQVSNDPATRHVVASLSGTGH